MWVIFSTIYPLIVSGNLTLYTIRAAVGFMTSYLIFLIPYFYGIKEKLKPENILKNLGKKATVEVEKNLSRITIPQVPFFHNIDPKLFEINDFAKGIHDAIMSAYHRNEYAVFELGLGELENLVEKVYFKQKNIAKHFAGPLASIIIVIPPIIERFKMIGEDVIENTYAFDTLVRKLHSLSDDALEKGIPELAKLILFQLGSLGYHAIDKKLHKPFESIARMLAFYSLSEAIDKKESELAYFIINMSEDLSKNAINIGMYELVKPIIKGFGDLGPSVIKKNKPESKIIIKKLLDLGSQTAEKGEFEISAFCVAKLFMFNACKLEEDLKNMIMDKLRKKPLFEVLSQRFQSIIKMAREEIKNKEMNLKNFNQFINHLKLNSCKIKQLNEFNKS